MDEVRKAFEKWYNGSDEADDSEAGYYAGYKSRDAEIENP